MKHFFKRIVLGMSALCAVMFMSSCLKDEGIDGPSNGIGDRVAAVMAINAVPGSPGLIVALDNNQLNNLAYGERFAYRELMVYRRAIPGDRLLRVFHPNNVYTNEEILRKDLNLTPGEYYSLIVVGQDDERMDVLVLEDDLEAPDAGKAKLRFVNLSPDAPALSFGLNGDASPWVENVAYKANGGFVTVDAGTELDLSFVSDESGEVAHAFKFKPDEKRVYTIVAIGLYDEKDQNKRNKFDHGIVAH